MTFIYWRNYRHPGGSCGSGRKSEPQGKHFHRRTGWISDRSRLVHYLSKGASCALRFIVLIFSQEHETHHFATIAEKKEWWIEAGFTEVETIGSITAWQ